MFSWATVIVSNSQSGSKRKRLRVLFFGQTGVDKRACVTRLATACLSERGLPPDPDNVRSRAYLRVFHLESAIPTAGDYIAYLDRFYAKQQARDWGIAWDSIVREISDQRCQHSFVTLHATYFRSNRFFSVADIDRIRAFNPDLLITLIDDARVLA